MSSDPGPNYTNDAATTFRVALITAWAWATSVEPFLRFRFGSRYFGLQAAAVPLLVAFYCYLFRGERCEPFGYFIAAYFAALLLHRLGRVRRWLRGEPEGHSRYAGDSWIPAVVPRLSDAAAKRFVEPLILFGLGLAALPASTPFGMYLWGAGLSLRFCESLGRVRDRERALDLNDAVIEQQSTAELFRRLRGERR